MTAKKANLQQTTLIFSLKKKKRKQTPNNKNQQQEESKFKYKYKGKTRQVLLKRIKSMTQGKVKYCVNNKTVGGIKLKADNEFRGKMIIKMHILYKYIHTQNLKCAVVIARDTAF